MEKTRVIKRRIKSVDKTRQITKTMEMVATSKLKRAQDRIIAARPYTSNLKDVLLHLRAANIGFSHPYLEEREEIKAVAVLLMTANRGLCGAFNANLIKAGKDFYEQQEEEGREVKLSIVGKKGASFFKFIGYPIENTFFDITDKPTLINARMLIEAVRGPYLSGEVDQVYIIFSEFRSPVEQRPIVEQLLPIKVESGDESPIASKSIQENIYEPTKEKILESLLPLAVENIVFHALMETAASEQGARRTAMKAASDNAEEMIKNLTRTFNKARQAQITQELAEIMGGVNALQG